MIAVRVVGALVALVALLVGASALILRSDWGGERLRRQVVHRVNDKIQGNLEIKRLSFGGDKVVVWGAVLREPDGQVVAQVARAEVDFSVMRALRKEIRITAVVIETPIVSLVSDEDGSNLSRATAPRRKTPATPPAPKKKTNKEEWVVRLDRFDLTRGDVSVAVVKEDRRTNKVHLAALGILASVRYATGNGSLDLTLQLAGQSQLEPVAPLRVSAKVGVHGDVYRFDADGELLRGDLHAHGMVDGKELGNSDASIALSVPQQELAGYQWGPLRIEGAAHPQTPPKLAILLTIPGAELTAKDRGQSALGIQGRLGLVDLARTGRALQALTGSSVAPLAGQGELDFVVEKTKAGQAVGFDGETKGSFEKLAFGDTVITRLTFHGQGAHLSTRAGSADFELAIASVNAGTSRLRDIGFSAKLHEQDLSATFALAAPARVDLVLAGRLDDDRHGFDLSNLALSFPGSRWASQGSAHLRFDETELSLSRFRLACEGQTLAIDGSRHEEKIAAHLALTGLRLGQLPTIVIDPKLRLDGELNVDVKAEGQADVPDVLARLDLKHARYQGFSNIDAKVDATLHGDLIDGTIGVEAPFFRANAGLTLPTDPLAPDAPIAMKLDVKHLEIGQFLRAAELDPLVGGRLNLKLRVDGSANEPHLDLTVEAFDLAVRQPPQASKAAQSVDLGHARVRVSYAERDARAEVDFASEHGGTLVVDARTRVDLSYPRAKRRIVAAKLPVHGKVVAKDLDVAWIAQFNPRVESLGGQVSADARLAGTVGDPQVVGDVRWKNGEVVATKPPPKVAPAPKNQQVTRTAVRLSSPR